MKRYSTALLSGVAAAFVLVATAPAFAQNSVSVNTALARQGVRINQLEAEIRRLTGENERLTYQLGQLEKRLEILSGEIASRAQTAAPAAAVPDATGTAENPYTPPPAGNARPPAVANNQVPGYEKGVRVLGTVRQGTGPLAANPPVKQEPPQTPEQLYERAQNLILKDRNFDQAEQVLRRFLKENPKHDLAANAHYWLGRTYFVRQDYKNAAFAFADGFQKHPKSDKAPANLLNLGMALTKIGKVKEACTTWAQLKKSYPKAPVAIKRRVSREQRAAKC